MLLETIVALLVLFPTLPMSLLFLAVTLYYDVRTREIPIGAVLALAPGVAVSFILYLLFSGALFFSFRLQELVLSMVFTGILVAVALALAKLGQLGYGDAVLVGVLGLLNPYTLPLPLAQVRVPAVLLVLVLGLAYIALETVANLVHNARRWAMFREATEGCTGFEKLYYALVGRVFTSEEFGKRRFYFPLLHEGMKRRVAKVGVEPLEGSGFEVKGKYVIASKGFVFALLLAVGYALTFIYALLHLPYG